MCYKSIKSQGGRFCINLLTIVGFSATSRRQNHMPLSCRDVDFSRHDVIFYASLLRRDVDLHVAT